MVIQCVGEEVREALSGTGLNLYKTKKKLVAFISPFSPSF